MLLKIEYLIDTVVKSQLVSPRRIISFPSLSEKQITFSSLTNASTGARDGLYYARTRKGLLLDGTISIRINSKSFLGTSELVQYLIESLI